MFQDRNADDFPGVDFPSNWRTTLSMDIRETQTDDLNMTDAEIQVKAFF